MSIRGTFTTADPETAKYGTYRGWNLYKFLWDARHIKVAATRYEFSDMRSPILHKDWCWSDAAEQYAYLDQERIATDICETKVKEFIDLIEDEGFEIYINRVWPDKVQLRHYENAE